MTKLIVITGFIVAFSAGMMAGFVLQRPRPDGSRPAGPGGRDSFMGHQLDLTADQQTKMKEIWQDVSRRGGGPDRGKRSQVRHDQEEAIAKLVRLEDRAAYDKIIADAHAKLDQMEADGRRSFQQAVEKTKAILSPEQLKKYDALLARPNDHDRDHPATRPSG